MRSRSTLILAGVLMLLGVATFVGCVSSPPMAPAEPEDPPAEPTFVRVEVAQVDSVGQPMPVQPKIVMAKIDGKAGGSLHNGRFDLEVPPGAWEGELVVTLKIPDPALMQCELTIDKPEANQFKVPVKLTGQCQNAVSAATTEDMIFVCQDEMTGQWKAVEGSSSSAVTGEVTAELQHFSQYGVVQGKAGW